MAGSPEVGYMGPQAAPFHCAHCKYLKAAGCSNKEVIEDLGANSNGMATVSPNGCCNEFEPKSGGKR